MAVCSPRLRHESQLLLLLMNHVTANKLIDHRGEIPEKIRFLFRHQTLADAVAQAHKIPCATFDYPNQQPFPDPNNYGANEMNLKTLNSTTAATHFDNQFDFGNIGGSSVLGLAFS